MAAGDPYVPDWTDAAAYAPLLRADRSMLAWEWLRRSAEYRAAAERAVRSSDEPGGGSATPGHWGLHAFELPHLGVPGARPMWRADGHPFVLSADAVSDDTDDAFDLQRLEGLSTLLRAEDGREHLLVSDGFRAIRIDVRHGSLQAGRVRLHHLLSGLEDAEKPLLTLRRLLALWRTGEFSRSLHSEEVRASRWVLMLRAHDGLSAGAEQREIAKVLLRPEAGEPRWRERSPSLRSQVQRLVRVSRQMASGGYRVHLL